MPTGYTSNVPKQTFEQFVLTCSKAFGALIHMRDEDSKMEITPPKVNSYHEDTLNKAKDELRKFEKMSESELKKLYAKEIKDERSRCEKALKENREQIQAYQDMQSKVVAWKPPTKDHYELQSFMISQLSSSINFDSMENYYQKELSKEPENFKTWKTSKLKKFGWDINYHADELNKDRQRVAERLKWINALLVNLGKEPFKE